MAENSVIAFNTRGYNTVEVDTVLDRSFKEFGQNTGSEDSCTVEQFFQYYDKLFFEIPITGETGSHQYLVNKSSQLYRLEENLIDIQPLLNEITQLKSQTVEYQQTIVNLKLKLAESGETSI